MIGCTLRIFNLLTAPTPAFSITFRIQVYLFVHSTSALQVSKQFFPDVAVGYDDPRVNLHIGDGIFTNFSSVSSVSFSFLFS